MISKYKLTFTEATDVGFIDPDTMRKMWYASYYGKGTTLEVADILSGNSQAIFAMCTDGEIAVIKSNSVKVQNL